MKKLISILTSLTLLTSLTSSYVGAVESEDPELYTLARSLGADTDCLKIVNYSHDYFGDLHEETGGYYLKEEYYDYYREYLKKTSVVEGVNYPHGTFLSLAFSGSCVGISLLEILSHNGVISPSDIQANAKTMSDITFDDDIDKTIFGYQWTQSYTEFEYYEQYLINKFSYEEQIDNLIETAEKCMADGKYFLITMHTPDTSHAVCGIGITDISREFNGVNYDKCILTLDSNCVDESKRSTPFSNNCCIYINSETKQSYIPAYDTGDKTPISYSAIDDDTLLNHRGLINPSETIDTDISSITKLKGSFGEFYRNTRIFAVSEDGEKYEYGDSSFNDNNKFDAIDKLDTMHIEMEHEYDRFPKFSYKNSNRRISFTLGNGDIFGDLFADYNAVFDISNDKISIENLNDEPLKAEFEIKMNDGSFDFAPYYKWDFWSSVAKKADIEITEKGMLIKPDGKVDMDVMIDYFCLDDNGNYMIDDIHFATEGLLSYPDSDRHIKTVNNVLISFEDGECVFLLDTNGDEIYDVPVEKGDVNFDGSIDASDASEVLLAYANMSTRNSADIDKVFADFNEDGIIDATDASDILAKYAELSTQ